MGAGRKKKTLHLKEKGETSWTTNCSVSARNLRKSDLGAVIFVCNHSTIKECHSELMFGLPAPHFAYVKNIRPGLALFLFNYSERKLHGIYEATSQGQLNINPYGWTADHADYTPYPAQVKIKIRTQCSPLTEDEFKPMIAENYHEPKIFWLELDRAQTHKLISMFTSRASVSRPLNMAIHKTSFSTSEGRQRGDDVVQVSGSSLAPLDNIIMGSWGDLGSGDSDRNGLHPKPPSGISYSAIVSGKGTSLPERPISLSGRKWSSLFESSTTNGSIKKDENFEPKVSGKNFQESGMEWVSPDVPLQSGEKDSFEGHNFDWAGGNYDAENQSFEGHNTKWGSENQDVETKFEPNNTEWGSGNYDAENQSFEPHNTEWGSGNYDAENQSFEPHNTEWGHGNNDAEWERPSFETSFEEPTGAGEGQDSHFPWLDDDVEWKYPSEETLPTCDNSCEAPSDSHEGHDGNLPCSDGFHADDDGSSASEMNTDKNEYAPEQLFADNGVKEACEELLRTETDSECSYSSAVEEMNSFDNHGEESIEGDKFSSERVAIADTASPGVQALLLKLMEEVEELKGDHQIVSSLKRELVESKTQIEFLKTRVQSLEFKVLPSTEDVEEVIIESLNQTRAVINDPIFIIGGFDGSSWLPDLCSYLPCQDNLISLAPMMTIREYSSAVTMNGALYVLGGGHHAMWHDSVESYNPLTDKWLSCPALNQKKGSLAGVSLFGKIFAIGGGYGQECFSNVEMLDLEIGKWISTRSMAHKRFAPAAAELNGAIYVVGGYNGKNYLKSAERFDPREHSWKSLRSMATKRGSHSLTVLNDKLYAIGGYNGAEIVSSIEIFDPRVGSWMMGESMNSPRGYCGAAVLGDKLHVIGGITENNVILETIEIYEENRGWETTDLKGVGKRCSFSAIVL